ncbi:J domain-containing protein [Halorussus halophilus]|uniref:J domain-containing protein n=1 Tax=Halorussus halophilus TaxID=2650975 RepID=UPI0013013D28|nr:J domain-containing protein [Halorussus halophilus]
MKQTKLLFGLASVFAGLATVQFVLGFVYSPVFFAVALPFAVAAYLIWYHASGRLAERVRQGRAGEYRDETTETGGFGAGPRESFSERSRFGSGFDAREQGRQRGNRRTRNRPPNQPNSGPSVTEASRTLGVTPDADTEQVRQAYRQKVKAVHPDSEDGDEEQFKQVQEAYERLQNRS